MAPRYTLRFLAPAFPALFLITALRAQVPVIDSVFATDGRSTTPFPFSPIEVVTERVVELGTGGYLGIGGAYVPGVEIQAAFTKFDVCGVPDSTFGNNGFSYITGGPGWQMKPESGMELADGSLLIHGTTAQGFGAYSSNQPTLMKLNADGTLDTSYGTDGILRQGFPDGLSCGFGTGLITLPDGKLLGVACRSSNVNGGSQGLSLFRYLPDGAPDASFASGGAVHISKPDYAVGSEAHVIGDTMVLVAHGRVFGDFSQELRIELNAFDTAGNYITAFGANGLVDDTTVFAGNYGPWKFSSVLDDEDRLIVFGATTGNPNGFLLIRFLSDGTRDLSFGVNGRATVPQLGLPGGNPAMAVRMSILSDGTLLCIGQVSGQGGIMDTQWSRLTPDGDLLPGTNAVLPAELHGYQVSDVVELTNGRLLAQARGTAPAPIGQVQMRFADPAVIMPHITPDGPLLTVSGTGPGFQWQLDGDGIAGATGTTITPTGNGTYTVEMTDVFGCAVVSAPFEMLNVGLPEIDAASTVTVVGPDANGSLTVRTDATFDYAVVDVRGALLMSGLLRQGVNAVRVDALPAGAYALVLRSGAAQRTVRFAKT